MAIHKQQTLGLFEDGADPIEMIEKEAIEFIRQHCAGQKVFVGFSGGKDSICTAKIMELSGVDYELYYSFTTIDPPEVVRFIRKHYTECKFLKPPQTFWRALYAKNVPSDRLRWCCTLLKKQASWKLPHTCRVMGIRAEESSRRSKRGRVNVKEKLGHFDHYPIFHWNEYQVWQFIERHNLAYPGLYDEGFDRLGCIVCPYHSEKTGRVHQMYRDRWPKYFARFERGVKEVWQKRVDQGKQMFYATPEEFIEAWYLDDASRWYAVEESEAQSDQLNLF